MVSLTVKRPTRGELARRRKIRKFWADHPESREDQRKTQEQIWADPQRRQAKSEEMKQFFADPDHPERREARRKSTERVMRSRKRRKTNSETLKRLKANTEFEARRLVGIRKAEAAEERKAARRATLAKTLAGRGVRKRAIRNSRKTQSTPEFRARASATGTKLWTELRAGRAALKEIAKAKNRGRGRPTRKDVYEAAAVLWEGGASWRELARKYDPDFATDPERAIDRMRKGVKSLMRSKKQETPR